MPQTETSPFADLDEFLDRVGKEQVQAQRRAPFAEYKRLQPKPVPSPTPSMWTPFAAAAGGFAFPSAPQVSTAPPPPPIEAMTSNISGPDTSNTQTPESSKSVFRSSRASPFADLDAFLDQIGKPPTTETGQPIVGGARAAPVPAQAPQVPEDLTPQGLAGTAPLAAVPPAVQPPLEPVLAHVPGQINLTPEQATANQQPAPSVAQGPRIPTGMPGAPTGAAFAQTTPEEAETFKRFLLQGVPTEWLEKALKIDPESARLIEQYGPVNTEQEARRQKAVEGFGMSNLPGGGLPWWAVQGEQAAPPPIQPSVEEKSAAARGLLRGLATWYTSPVARIVGGVQGVAGKFAARTAQEAEAANATLQGANALAKEAIRRGAQDPAAAKELADAANAAYEAAFASAKTYEKARQFARAVRVANLAVGTGFTVDSAAKGIEAAKKGDIEGAVQALGQAGAIAFLTAMGSLGQPDLREKFPGIEAMKPPTIEYTPHIAKLPGEVAPPVAPPEPIRPAEVTKAEAIPRPAEAAPVVRPEPEGRLAVQTPERAPAGQPAPPEGISEKPPVPQPTLAEPTPPGRPSTFAPGYVQVSPEPKVEVPKPQVPRTPFVPQPRTEVARETLPAQLGAPKEQIDASHFLQAVQDYAKNSWPSTPEAQKFIGDYAEWITQGRQGKRPTVHNLVESQGRDPLQPIMAKVETLAREHSLPQAVPELKAGDFVTWQGKRGALFGRVKYGELAGEEMAYVEPIPERKGPFRGKAVKIPLNELSHAPESAALTGEKATTAIPPEGVARPSVPRSPFVRPKASEIAKEPEPTPEATRKEPWQMTEAEWDALPSAEQNKYFPADPRERPLPYHSNFHQYEVEEALKAGKPVPAEVLRDYPTLRAEAPPAKPLEGTQPPVLEWGKTKPHYLRTIPSHAAFARYMREAKEVGYIDIPHGHRAQVDYFGGKLLRVGGSPTFGTGRPVHEVIPAEHGENFHWLQRKDVAPIAEKFGAKISAKPGVHAADIEYGGGMGLKEPRGPGVTIKQPTPAETPEQELKRLKAELGKRETEEGGVLKGPPEVPRRMQEALADLRGKLEDATEDEGAPLKRPQQERIATETAKAHGVPPQKLMEAGLPKPSAPAKGVLKGPPGPTPPKATAATPTTAPFGRPRASDELTRLGEIANELQDYLKTPIGFGRFRERARGIFKVRAAAVRLRSSAPFSTKLHELAHHLHKFLFGTRGPTGQTLNKSPLRPYRDELGPLDYEPQKARLEEGFAEFTRLYLENPAEAQSRAPDFYRYFESAVGKHPQLAAMLARLRKNISAEAAQSPLEQVKSDIHFGKAPRRTVSQTWQEIVRVVRNELDPLRREGAALYGLKPSQHREMPTAANAFILAGNLSGRVQATVARFLREGGVDYETGKLVPGTRGWEQIMLDVEKLGKNAVEDFNAYLSARTARERMEHKPGMVMPRPKETYEAAIAEAEKQYRTFSTLAGDLYSLGESALDYLAKSGRVPPETLKKLREMHREHVPLYRWFDPEGLGKIGGGPPGAKGFGKVPLPFRRAKGGTQEILPPTTNFLLNLAAMVRDAELQRPNRALYEWTKQPDSGWAVEEVAKRSVPTTAQLGEIRKALEDAGYDPDAGDPEAVFRIWRAVPERDPKFATHWTPDGKEHVIEIKNPAVVQAVNSLSGSQLEWWMKLFTPWSRQLRFGVSAAPVFAGRHFIRHSFYAAMRSRYYSPPAYLMQIAKGLADVIGATPLSKEAVDMALSMRTMPGFGRDRLQKFVEGELARKREGSPYSLIFRHPLEAIGWLAEAAHALTSGGDLATRLPEYAAARDEAMKRRGATTPNQEDMIYAAYQARNVSIDFSEMGAGMRSLSAMAAFSRAHMLGQAGLAEDFAERPKRAIPWHLLLTAATLGLYLYNRKDPDYHRLSHARKAFFWNVRNPFFGNKAAPKWVRDIHFLWLPKAWLSGFLFSTVPEAIVEAYDTKNPKLLDSLGSDLLKTAIPNFIPTALMAVWHWATNKDAFGRPIVPASKENVAPQYQYGPYTPAWTISLGKAIGESPAKIHQWWRDWAGNLGADMDSVADMIDGLNSKTGERPARGAAGVPFIKGFVSPSPGFDAAPIEQFYERAQELEQQYATARLPFRGVRKIEAMTPEQEQRARQILAQSPELAEEAAKAGAEELERKTYELAKKYIGAYRDAAQMVRQDPEMTGEQKQAAIRRAEKAAIETAERVQQAFPQPAKGLGRFLPFMPPRQPTVP